MNPRQPRRALSTHTVENQPPPFVDFDLYTTDVPLRQAVEPAAGWATERLAAFGARAGSSEVIEWGFQANRNPPTLKAFDRYGHRIDEVEFHPAYHALMAFGLEAGTSAVAWTATSGGHTVHAALLYLMSQVEPGVCCPMSMTYAAVPALRATPAVADVWEPRIRAARYDGRARPPGEKTGCTVGMAMTEKQGGSDVRANTTRAVPLGGGGPGGEYELTGHKWFCSAPMSDAFLTLAHTDGGLSCFLVPKWRPDDTRNTIEIQRLKDKLGDRANASSEIEYRNAFGWMVGEEGRGVRTIISMVHHTRLDCLVAPAAFMRQALTQAVWHVMHRDAFGRTLIEQPLMRNVLADLALEAEATVSLAFRIARAFDAAADGDPMAAAYARLATPIAKYWHNKRVVSHVGEAMECLGGAGYVEESVMPRVYRQAPLNGIWEGSGNVICLDVLRAVSREPATLEALVAHLESATGRSRAYDERLATLKARLEAGASEAGARRLVEETALALQAASLLLGGDPVVAEAYCATRLGTERPIAWGAAPLDTHAPTLLARVLPEAS
jgi:putative acyl-CoA dehydrogenase